MNATKGMNTFRHYLNRLSAARRLATVFLIGEVLLLLTAPGTVQAQFCLFFYNLFLAKARPEADLR